MPSNSLKEVCKYFDLPNKKDAGGLSTWIDVIVNKDKAALDHLLFYGDGDIVSLEAVFNKINGYIKPNMQYAVLRGKDKYHCPECGELGRLRKSYTTAAGTMQHYFSCVHSNCVTSFKVNNKTYMDFLQHKIINNIL